MKCKKVKYGSEKDALFALDKIKQESNRKVIPLRTYKCHCGAWHLTSRMDVKEIQKENEQLKQEISQLKDINVDLQNKIINKFYEDKAFQSVVKRDVMVSYMKVELNKLRQRCVSLEENLFHATTKCSYLEQQIKKSSKK